MKQIIFSFFILISLSGFAQNGTFRGTVTDAETGETLVGVSLAIKNTTFGASTDLDGMFTIDIPARTYDVEVSYISYQTKVISGLVIKPGEVTVLETFELRTSAFELKEVVVVAESVRRTEAALQNMKRKSPAMLDGISSSKMELTGDGTVVEAAKRVTGVSIEGGKYVYIRGLGDRYTKTTLNGVDIPGLDPDKNTLQMDIFPTNLINNLLVSKNFTADMPADFTGGLMNIETKDFPQKKIMDVSFSLGYNPSMHFNSDNLTYNGGSTDFLGFDDGTRALPDGANSTNIPTPISGATQEETNAFISSFNPELGAIRKTSLMDVSAGIAMGNQWELKNAKNPDKDPKMAYVFSLSYKSDYKYYDQVEYGEYQRYLDPDKYELRYATRQTGQMGEHNVLLGGLAGLAYKTKLSKLRMMLLVLQNGESRAGIFDIDNDGEAVGQSGYFANSHNLEYNQRGIKNLLFHGSHKLKNRSWDIDWRVSPTYSSSFDPDLRKTALTYTSVDTLFVAGAGGNPSRIWRSLNELNATAKIDVSKLYFFQNEEAKLKFGASHNFKYRDYEILFYDIQFFGGQSWENITQSEVLNAENLFPNKPNSIYYQSGNNHPNPNEYQSNVNNSGIYFSNEAYLFKHLKSIIGLRAENYVMRHTGRDQQFASGDTANGKNLDNTKVLDSFDLFPSANLIYELTKKQNLRFAYSKTIARPSFKELSFAQILDPISNRIFNGSLFTYSDWDGNLVETRIDNLDLRWELFMESDEIISVSAFYKAFDNPIELVRIPEQQTSTEYQTRNVGNGELLGVELEVRKNLGFISESIKNIGVSANFTYVDSKIDMTDAEYNSRRGYLKTGETLEKTRQMAGQSPYLMNAGITYNHIEKGISGGLFYNVKGPTLHIVGAGLFPDIYVKPFHSLNFSLSKKFGESGNTILDIKVANILDEDIESYYQSYNAENQIYSKLSAGPSFSLGFKHKF